jgi:hypothetical protein
VNAYPGGNSVSILSGSQYAVLMASALSPSEEIIRDGAQAAAADFDRKVEEGEAAVREFFRLHPESEFSLRELRERTSGDRSSSVMTTAFINLEESGELVVDYVASVARANL